MNQQGIANKSLRTVSPGALVAEKLGLLVLQASTIRHLNVKFLALFHEAEQIVSGLELI